VGDAGNKQQTKNNVERDFCDCLRRATAKEREREQEEDRERTDSR